MSITRCEWAGTDPLYVSYHDTEWGTPLHDDQMLFEFLSSKNSLGDERRAALKFVEQNLRLFPTDDDAFRSRIMALQRERDPQLAAAAEALLPKIGVNLDDRDMYRRA